MVAITFATGCAWRAVYVLVNGRQVAHLGVDPFDGSRPQAFGQVGRWGFRFRLPTVAWRYPCGSLYLLLYKLSRRFWAGVDGRYGWGSRARAEGQS